MRALWKSNNKMRTSNNKSDKHGKSYGVLRKQMKSTEVSRDGFAITKDTVSKSTVEVNLKWFLEYSGKFNL
ncbi:hypothetical protein AGMMS49990_09450 [Endomicrobiia bacterium]|nr:hypothetical protein AGMMS49990_09450 [Endomicrobiia bacterium]